jgi:hypothetical protein
MKSIILLLISTILSIPFASCEKFSSRWEIPESDETVIANRAKEIIDALGNNDKEALRSMFCEYVLDESEDFDSRLDYITDFFEGKSTAYEGGINSISESSSPGRFDKIIQSKYTVVTDKNAYIVFIVEQTNCAEYPNKVGLYTLQVKLGSDKNTKLATDPPFPGIYIPE